MNKYKSLAPFLVVMLVFGSFMATVSSQEAHLTAPLADGTLLAQLEQAAQGDLRVSYHHETGLVRFLAVHPSTPLDQPHRLASGATAQEAARAFLDVYGPLFGLRDQARELTVMRDKARDGGRNFTRFQQTYRGIPIVGGELIVQINALRQVISVNGEILPDLALDTTPTLSAASARQTALDKVARDYGLDVSELQASQPELWIYNPLLLGGPGPRLNALVWRTEVTPLELAPIRELVLVDARLGAIALHFNQVDTARNRETYDAGNTKDLRRTLVCDESNSSCPGGDDHEKYAHIFAGDTYNFYLAEHGRDSIDDHGMTIISTVHYDVDFNNAFWSDQYKQMVYGDKYGYPLADDIVAHELTHGVTNYESNLFYFYQSGAINESLSDVWGEFVDQEQATANDVGDTRWVIGEDITGTDALRNMQDPTLLEDPDRMSSPWYYCNQSDLSSGAGDSGGVHTNSGVNNKAVYLMTDGDTFNGQTVSGLGYEKVVDLYYEVQTNLLTSAADYADLYDALLQACSNLGYSASDCQEVQDALNAVEMNQQPSSCPATAAPVCDSGVPEDVFFDDIELGGGNWTAGSIVGSSDYWFVPQTLSDAIFTGPYSASGQGNIWGFNQGDDNDPGLDTGSTSDTYLAMNSDVPLPADAYLHFAHSYGFESDAVYYYDGGVLEYSTNNGGAWNDAGPFFEYNGYDAALTTIEGNPLGGRSAFAADSRGYISSRLDLSSLAGQDVRFRFRIGTDEYFYDYGWFIDDVRIYTCVVTNTAPILSGLPDQTLRVNNSSNNAIDLWSFAADDESGDAELIFSIDNADADAGIDLDNNRYVDINPTIGWTGQTDVVVRVSDPGGLYATATFNLLVVDKIWDGSASNDWHTAANWTLSGVPTSTHDVLIPDVSNAPVVSNGDAAVDDLFIEPGAVLDLTSRALTVGGALTNDGTIKQAQEVGVGVTANFYGIDITVSDIMSPAKASQTTLANVAISVSGNQFCQGRHSGVKRCYDIDPAAAMTATVRFYFSEAERNEQSLDDLLVWHYDGAEWTEQDGPYTRGGAGDTQYVEAQNIGDFSLFALDGPAGSLIYIPLVIQRYPPLPDTPVLNSISNNDGDGIYSVNWNSAYLADSYTLQEDDNPAFSSPTPYFISSNAYWEANDKQAGTYYYHVKATNVWGDSSWSNIQAVRVYPPTTFYPNADTQVLQGEPDSNYGDALYMEAGYNHVGCEDAKIARSLVQFDLSSIPAGTSIVSARLHLYLRSSCDYADRSHTLTAHRTAGAWSEMAVIWNDDTACASEASGSALIQSQTWDWYSMDVTALVRGWVNGSYSNYGLTLRGPESSSSGASLEFYTRESLFHDPYLSVEYGGVTVSEHGLPAVSAPAECGPRDVSDLSAHGTYEFARRTECSLDGRLEASKRQK